VIKVTISRKSFLDEEDLRDFAFYVDGQPAGHVLLTRSAPEFTAALKKGGIEVIDLIGVVVPEKVDETQIL